MILQADARDLPLPDESVHLIVTSPPYNARVPYDGYTDWLPWHAWWEDLILPALRECYRVLVPGGRLCLNLANLVRSNVPDLILVRDGYTPQGKRRPSRLRANRRCRTPSVSGAHGEPWAQMTAPLIWSALEQLGFLPREQLTWLKAHDPADTATSSTAWGTWCSAQNPVLRAVAEPVYIASKFTHARPPGPSDLTPAEFKAWTRNAWYIPTVNDTIRTVHPAPFPVELPRRLIKLYSYVGDIVLDPFAGSGTTVWAAILTRRRGIGCDLSLPYCRYARDRCSQTLLPLEAP